LGAGGLESNVFAVKCAFSNILLALAITSTFMVAQEALKQTPANGGFNWNWHNSRELNWKESIGRSKELPNDKRAELIEAIATQLRLFTADLGIGSDEELRRVAADTRIAFVNLGGGARSIVAQAGGEKSGCSPTGNCPFWIFKKVRGHYSVLLDSEAQTFTIQRTRTKSLTDVVLGRHSSAFESELVLYRFNGHKYEAGPCFSASWTDDGGEHTLRQPHLTPCNGQ
jgi:hypothetical protein